MSAIRFESELRRISAIDPAAAGTRCSDNKARLSGNSGGGKGKPVEMSLVAFCCFVFCPLRRCPVQRGRWVSHGATLESAEQPVQSQTQLHHLIDRSVLEAQERNEALINPQNRHYDAFTAIDPLRRALTGAVHNLYYLYSTSISHLCSSHNKRDPALKALWAPSPPWPLRLLQGSEDTVGGEQARGASGLPPAVRHPLRVRGALRIRAELQHLLPQQEGAATAVVTVPERWAALNPKHTAESRT